MDRNNARPPAPFVTVTSIAPKAASPSGAAPPAVPAVPSPISNTPPAATEPESPPVNPSPDPASAGEPRPQPLPPLSPAAPPPPEIPPPPPAPVHVPQVSPSAPAPTAPVPPPPPPPVIAGYAAPAYGAASNSRENVVSFGAWVGTLILLSIPLLNLILLLVWAFSAGTNRNLQNFSRAVFLIGILLTVFYGVLIGVAAVIGMQFMP